ncbi:MAG TPA: ABC transporter substrate-binding protein [Casimicrobiaceae bacterium]|nr:ABC transporter substrate-binding protein [Casimicrobiaceae bacterium]
MGVARNACRAWRGAIGVAAALGLAASALAAEPIKIGLVAALSGPSAQSGEAITQGLTIAIDEINASGGVLGRPLELVKRDDESSPPKGATAARELIANEKVAAIFGGLDTPVSLAIVPIVNRDHVPYMGVWAAGTPITRNGANPNFAFRVSAVDVLVDEALLKYAQKSGAKKPGLILINNPWGESNEKGLTEQAKHLGITLAGVEKFEDRDVDVVPQLTRLKNAGADALILVANAAPGAQVMKARERMGWKVPVISHWGVSGGRFPELAGPTAGDVVFVQTYSFFGDQKPTGRKVLSELEKQYKISGPEGIISPVGVADAYDAMHLVALAIKKAGSTSGDAVRKALLDIDQYQGLIKTYHKPFSDQNHDALSPDDYIFVRFEGTRIVPVR